MKKKKPINWQRIVASFLLLGMLALFIASCLVYF